MFSTIASVLFVPSASVLNAVNAVKKANFNSGPVVGLQLRRQMREGRDKIGARTSDSHVAQFLATAASELQRLGPTSRAFLATDHEPMRMEVRKALGDRVFWQSGDISASSSSAMHRAFVDLWLLGETVSVITTCGSTFGYVAHARRNLKPIVVTLDTAEVIRLNTSEPCMHTWPFLLELKCFRGNFHTAMASFGHPHCRPWDMEWFRFT